jgi:hypothetical protein
VTPSIRRKVVGCLFKCGAGFFLVQQDLAAAQHVIVRGDAGTLDAYKPIFFSRTERDLERVDDAAGNIVLHREERCAISA